MPYIKPEDYDRACIIATTPGELNYAMTAACIAFVRGEESALWLDRWLKDVVEGHLRRWGESYTVYNETIGALYCCGMELLRRVNDSHRPAAMYCQARMAQLARELYYGRCADYEDTKIEKNGDVYPKEIING